MNEKIYYCYVATNLINKKKYVGFASDPHQRWREHKRVAEKGGGYAFHQAIRKYKWKNFLFEIVCGGRDKRAMLEYIEPFLIDQHNSLLPHGYNMRRKVIAAQFTIRKSPSEQTRDKIRRSLLGSTLSVERRNKISEALKKRSAIFKERGIVLPHRSGFKMSLIQKEKISDALRGRKFSDERKLHISKSLNGRRLSQEHKQKLSDAAKKFTVEQRIRITEAVRVASEKQYDIMFPDGHIEHIKNLSQFCRDKCLSVGMMRHVIKGRSKQYKGYQAIETSPSFVTPS